MKNVEMLLLKYNKPVTLNIIHTDIFNNLPSFSVERNRSFELFNSSVIKITFTKKRINYKINNIKSNRNEVVQLLNKQFLLNGDFVELNKKEVFDFKLVNKYLELEEIVELF